MARGEHGIELCDHAQDFPNLGQQAPRIVQNRETVEIRRHREWHRLPALALNLKPRSVGGKPDNPSTRREGGPHRVGIQASDSRIQDDRTYETRPARIRCVQCRRDAGRRRAVILDDRTRHARRRRIARIIPSRLRPGHKIRTKMHVGIERSAGFEKVVHL